MFMGNEFGALNLREALNCKFGFCDLLSMDKAERAELSVRHRHIWRDTMKKLTMFTHQELEKPLYIDFIREFGQDFGGLTRDFFSDIFDAATGIILDRKSVV